MCISSRSFVPAQASCGIVLCHIHPKKCYCNGRNRRDTINSCEIHCSNRCVHILWPDSGHMIPSNIQLRYLISHLFTNCVIHDESWKSENCMYSISSYCNINESQLSCIFTSQREALCLIPVQFRNHQIGVYHMNIACKITTSLRFLSLSILYEICTQFVFCCVLS